VNPAYIRVSTTDQKDHGVGLDAQRQAIIDTAARHQLIVGEFFCDDASGSTPIGKRPGLSAALAALADGGTLIVHARDRLARSVDVMSVIRRQVGERRGRILSVAEGFDTCAAKHSRVTMESAAARLGSGVQDVVSEFNRLQIVARVQAAMAECIRTGRFTGRAPFGWDVENVEGQRTRQGKPLRRLVINPAEQEILEIIRSYRAEGMGYSMVARQLNARGIKSKLGGKWASEQVRSTLAAAGRPERAGLL
jgi:DNA invertase Pin-like site-specific DNA recombinase